jgi:hypothetical protein
LHLTSHNRSRHTQTSLENNSHNPAYADGDHTSLILIFSE